MDPLTAALNVAYASITLATKIWDATPDPLKATSAADWAKFVHNISDFVITLQGRINSSLLR